MLLHRFLPAGLAFAAAGSLAAVSLASLPSNVFPVQDEVNQTLNLQASTTIELDVNPALVGLQIQIDLPIEGNLYRLDLWPHSVRAEGFRLIEHLADGTERDVDPGPVNTLRGEVVGMPGSAIAGGMMPDGLYLTVIFPDGQQFWLEPLVGRVVGAGKNHYALYRAGDALAGGFCATTDDQRLDGDAIDIPPGGETPRGLTTWTAQMATDADVEFHNRWGGTTNANSRISLVTNTMNLQYERDVDIRHTISVTRVRTAEPDPYSTTDPATLNTQITAAWTGDTNTKDVIQLFTGRDMAGSNIGRANAIGSICNNQNSNCYSQSDFNNNFASATDLSAHELGHLWDGVHCTCSSPASTMNPSISSINRFGVNANDTADTDIPAYRNTRVCLTTAGSATPPPNDLCASAVRLFPGSYGINNALAANDGPAACGSIGADIWYFYVAPCNGTVTLETCSETGFDTVLAAYSGSCASLTQLACNDDTVGCGTGSPARQSRISFAVDAGETYRLRVGGFSGLTGTGILTLSQATCPAPINNNCASATLISSNTDVAFSTYGATTDGPLESSCLSFGDNTVGSDIWYRWVATCTDAVTVTLCGSAYDTRLAVYGACPGGVNQAIACNDDACGLQSSVTFNAVTGATYRFRVGGFNNNVGVGTIRVIACPPPPNDACASAINVSAGGTFNGTLDYATNDSAASCGSSATNPDVWYSYTSGCGGNVRFTTCGTFTTHGVDTVLTLFSACGGVELVCNDDSNCGAGFVLDSTVSANLAPGQTIRIRVSKFGTRILGPFILNVFTSGNNDCANASPIGLGSLPFCNTGATTDGPNDGTLCNQSSDIWYRYTATCNAPMRVSTCGANYDSEIAIYPDLCPAVAPAIACNDDSCALQSNVTFPASAGVSYLIRVGSFGGSTGSGMLSVRLGGDWNDDGSVNSGDISSYLTAWLASVNGFNRNADFNNDNVVNSGDISAFLTAWLAAINGGC